MEDEYLLQMLEFAVAKAVDALAEDQGFTPFAYALSLENEAIAFSSDYKPDEEAYESLWQGLKKSAEQKRIKAIILLQDCTIPESFNIEGDQSIRVHVEHSENIDEKIAGRLLYIPYALLKDTQGQVEVKLFKPEPVAFAHEIFVRESV